MKERLVSLDAFRGITIAGMILVNNPGSWGYVYAPLGHAKWHGWTPTDLIFPFFLFIVGVAMSFALSRPLQDPAVRKKLYIKIIRRTLIIYGLGLFMAAYPKFNFSTLRLVGVLPRIAICYCIAAFITLNTKPKGQALIVAGLLFLYWGMMTLIPVPGFGAGDLSVQGNLAAYIDNSLLHGHMWKEMWDPEGFVSTIPAIATTLLGVLTGHLLRSGLDKKEIAGWLFTGGWIAILVGLVWDIVFPINKALWTSSYVVFTAGAALQFLGFCYWLIDVKGYKRWAKPALIYGMNAITVFFLSGMVVKTMIWIKMDGDDGKLITLYTWIYQNLFVPWAGPMNGSLAFAVTTVLFWFSMMAILYQKKIFIKI